MDPNLPTLSLSHRVHKTVLYISVSFAVSYIGLLLMLLKALKVTIRLTFSIIPIQILSKITTGISVIGLQNLNSRVFKNLKQMIIIFGISELNNT